MVTSGQPARRNHQPIIVLDSQFYRLGDARFALLQWQTWVHDAGKLVALDQKIAL
jgi:hypothetical protein